MLTSVPDVILPLLNIRDVSFGEVGNLQCFGCLVSLEIIAHCSSAVRRKGGGDPTGVGNNLATVYMKFFFK